MGKITVINEGLSKQQLSDAEIMNTMGGGLPCGIQICGVDGCVVDVCPLDICAIDGCLVDVLLKEK